jgi:DNA mismatch repair protein MutS
MMQVNDLKLKEDVLPFFNFTNNIYAEEQLLYLLTTAPETETEISDRTAVIKGIIANWAVLENFTYRKLDLLQVHAFMVTIAGTALSGNKLHNWLRLKIAETERQQLQSGLVQLILLLNGLQLQYLNRMNSAAFPGKFKEELLHAISFLNKLNLNRLANEVQEQRFKLSDVIRFADQLKAIDNHQAVAFWKFFFSFEAYWSVAKAAQEHGFTFPAFKDDAFEITDFYHPVIKQPVKNTIELCAAQNVLLLTGPNMSGKSTVLKSIGLCVYLTRVGFPVPATTCTIPFFQTVAVAINLNDNLREGYSHFMAEINNLKAILNSTQLGNKCFAVFDEIFRGTNTDDALDITRETIHGLAQKQGSYFLISTHLLQLEEYLDGNTSEKIKKCFIECKLDNNIPEFTYRLKQGWSQLKIGRMLFEKEGLVELLAK